jgi:ADP-ribosylation factor-binding protein GGA
MTAHRNPGSSSIEILAAFSNMTFQPISDVHFQVAIEKAYTLQLRPQSGRSLQPNEKSGIKQVIFLPHVDVGKGNAVKMRWRVGYKVGTEAREEQGQVPPLGIS